MPLSPLTVTRVEFNGRYIATQNTEKNTSHEGVSKALRSSRALPFLELRIQLITPLLDVPRFNLFQVLAIIVADFSVINSIGGISFALDMATVMPEELLKTR